jgi:hypothetical protein
VLLAGLPVPDRLALDLVRILRARGVDDTAATLDDAHAAGRRIVTLTVADREAIAAALADCPYGLAELRGVLVLQDALRPTAVLVRHAARAG